MATRILSRSAWTSTSNQAPGIKQSQTEIYLHYPGQSAAIGRASESSTAVRLRGYRRMHVAGQYSEIAYNWAVDQTGRIWELRGKRQCGGNGGRTTNRRGQGILVLVGNSETPTADCIAGVRACISMIRDWQPTARKIRGHRDSFEASTACPGNIVHALIKDGAFEPGAGAPGSDAAEDIADAVQDGQARSLKVDGRFGTSTVKRLQRWLNSKGAKLTVDGKFGPKTIAALQRVLGTPVDGEVSNQSYKGSELGNGITGGWDYDGRGAKGSTLVRALQKLVGVIPDGIWYEGTTTAIQKYLNKAA